MTAVITGTINLHLTINSPGALRTMAYLVLSTTLAQLGEVANIHLLGAKLIEKASWMQAQVSAGVSQGLAGRWRCIFPDDSLLLIESQDISWHLQVSGKAQEQPTEPPPEEELQP
jgi:hypothetical protein